VGIVKTLAAKLAWHTTCKYDSWRA